MITSSLMVHMMKRHSVLGFLLVACLGLGCGPRDGEQVRGVNPPAPGFNLQDSDPAAVELADSVMMAMGGREGWDNTRFISWNFFGRRDLVWDKQTGDVRIESQQDSTIYLVNINTMVGTFITASFRFMISHRLPS